MIPEAQYFLYPTCRASEVSSPLIVKVVLIQWAIVSFSSCQRNLIKTFQIEGMIALNKKMDLIFSWDLLNGQK